MSRSRERRRRSDQLEAAAVAIYVVALLLAFAVIVLRALPPSSAPAIQAIAFFLVILASLLLAVSRWIESRDDERL
jgi:protein-S-isoprenylcysteine O-methyltransferase Ste14